MTTANTMQSDQEFDDDAVLQLALAMSMASEATSPTSPKPAEEDATTAEMPAVEGEAAPMEDESADVHVAPATAEPAVVAVAAPAAAAPAASEPAPAVPEPTPPEPTPPPAAEEARPAAKSPVKKKKKKNAYASMMAGIMAPTMTDEEKAAEQLKKLQSGLGGGTFSKLDKL